MWRLALTVALLAALACTGPVEGPPGAIGQPAPTSGTVASLDGLPVAWTSVGQGSPTLLFVHCWTCDQSYWREQTAIFAADHQVVTLDLGGHGASGTDRAEWTLAALAEDVVAVVKTLDLENVVLVGHSMGGPVSLLAAAELPRQVVGVVAVDTLHDAELVVAPEIWDGLVASYRQDWGGTCNRFVRSMFPDGADPNLADEIAESMCKADPEIAVALFESFPSFDASAALSAVRVPVRAINAAGFPTAIETNRKYADYDAVVLEGVGHFPQLERPGEFNARLEVWLDEIRPTAE